MLRRGGRWEPPGGEGVAGREGVVLRRLAAAALAVGLALGPAGSGTALAAAVPADDSYSVLEDGSLTVPTPGILDNDDWPAGQSPCLGTTDQGNLRGSAQVQADGAMTYQPAADYNGAPDDNSFTYALSEADSTAECPGSPVAVATVRIAVTAVNDAPTVTASGGCLAGSISVAEDSGPFDAACVTFDPGPANESGQTLAGWVVESEGTAVLSSGPIVTQAGRLQFTPSANQSGSFEVSIRARDSGGTANGGVDLSTAIQVQVNVTPVNDAPTATADSFIVLKDRTLNVGVPGVLLNDDDIDSSTISAVKVNNPSRGTLTLAADGSFSYTPQAGYEGPDAFSYKASDGSLSSPTRVVSLNVTAIPPVNTPTPIPTIAPPTPTLPPTTTLPPGETPAPTDAPEPTPTADPSATLGPSQSPSPSSSLAPGATPTPTEPAGEEGLSLPVLLVIVLLVILLGFGASVYVPRWLNAQARGKPMDPE